MRRRSKSQGGNSRCKSEGTARTPDTQGKMEEERKTRGREKIMPSVGDPDREQAGSEGVQQPWTVNTSPSQTYTHRPYSNTRANDLY